MITTKQRMAEFFLKEKNIARSIKKNKGLITEALNTKQSMQSLSLVVKYQYCIGSRSPDIDCYYRIWYAVFHQILRDAFLPNTDGCTDADKHIARRLLLTDMACLVYGGVDPEWFRKTLKDCGLWYLLKRYRKEWKKTTSLAQSRGS